MFRGVGAIVYKEIRHVARDPATLVLAILIPITQLLIFGYAIDSDVRHIPTVVLDQSMTRQSREFVRKLEATSYFDVHGPAADIREVLDALRAGSVRVGVVIDRDFAADSARGATPKVQVLLDGSDPAVANQARHTVLQLAQAGTAARTDVRPRILYNEDGRSAMFYVPGLAAVIFQLVLQMLTAFALVKEREAGTLEQLLVTPVSRAGLMAGKLLPFVGIGLLAAVIVYGAMVAIFSIPIRGGIGVLAALTGVFLFTSLSLGLVISSFARTQLHAMLVSFAILMPSTLLSGFAFPRETMPAPIFALSFLLPSTYFVGIMRGVVLRGAGFTDLLPDTLPLLGIGLLLFTVGVLRFRKRLD